MTSLESFNGMKNVEHIINPELEKKQESEHKLTPLQPEILEFMYKHEGLPIEQIYLSTPFDESSLRVRAVYKPEGNEYTATRKGRGKIVNGALQRPELEIPLSEEAFNRYQAFKLPTVYKFRTKVTDGVTIDFFDDELVPVLVEVEHDDPVERLQRINSLQELTGNGLLDRSDDPLLTNEAIAWRMSGMEIPKPPESLDVLVNKIVDDMVGRYATGKSPVVITLDGMPGSGKSTVAKAVEERIAELFGEAFRPMRISTDDYHFGARHLRKEYGNDYSSWDQARTYNLRKLAEDLRNHAKGVPIQSRSFSFETEEPVLGERMPFAQFIIVEGIHAGTKELNEIRDRHFQMPTSLATAVDWDLNRMMNRANRAFPDEESRFKYLMEEVLPMFMSMERPDQQYGFSACARPLGERAWMLTALSGESTR